MLNFGNDLLLWRLDRKLTQAELAEKAGVTRPNLSAMESGKRDVTLRTLSALARALDVSPGTLADGIPPHQNQPKSGLSREAMERIADAVAYDKTCPNPQEQWIAERLKLLTRSRLQSAGVTAEHSFRIGRKTDRAWLELATLPKPELNSLIQRISERRPLH